MFRFRSAGALLSAIVLTTACSAERSDETGEIVTAGSLDAFSMQIGDCYDDQDASVDEVTDVSGTPCSEPHDNEVFALFNAEMDKFPGENAIKALAEEGCIERFETYVGMDYQESVLAVTHLTPTAGSWSQADDREVVCVLYHMEFDKLEGTAKGTAM